MFKKIKHLRSIGWWDFTNSVSDRLQLLKTQLYYRRFFGAIGQGSIIRRPVLITAPSCIKLGAFVSIRDGARIELIDRPGFPKPALSIGDRASFEQGLHLVCSGRITIADDVAFAARCNIVDTSHPFDDLGITTNIGAHINMAPAQVTIHRRAFIGVGVTILPNVEIGEYSVIGAHSVVTSSIPAFAVASGVPARVIRMLK